MVMSPLPEKLGGWLRSAKDVSTSAAARLALDKFLSDYGRMLNLQIDSKNHTLQCEVLLKGESSPLKISIENYELVQDSTGAHVIIHKASASREWISVALSQLVCGKKIRVPDQYAAIVRLLA